MSRVLLHMAYLALLLLGHAAPQDGRAVCMPWLQLPMEECGPSMFISVSSTHSCLDMSLLNQGVPTHLPGTQQRTLKHNKQKAACQALVASYPKPDLCDGHLEHTQQWRSGCCTGSRKAPEYRSALAKETPRLLYSLLQLPTDKQLQHQTQSLQRVCGLGSLGNLHLGKAMSGGSAVINHGTTQMASLEVTPIVSMEICTQAASVHKVLSVSKK
ncbi:uncharacterized protein ACIB01_001595 [Guaruba guarouba]